MDVAISPSPSGTESLHLPYDALHMNSLPSSTSVQQSRHSQYTVPASSTPRSPGRSLGPAVEPSSEQEHSGTDQPLRFATGLNHYRHPGRREVNDAGSRIEPNGQDHDRMDMETESDDTSSEESTPESSENSGTVGLVNTVLEDDEIMDTSPDSPPSEEPPPLPDHDMHNSESTGQERQQIDVAVNEDDTERAPDSIAASEVSAGNETVSRTTNNSNSHHVNYDQSPSVNPVMIPTINWAEPPSTIAWNTAPPPLPPLSSDEATPMDTSGVLVAGTSILGVVPVQISPEQQVASVGAVASAWGEPAARPEARPAWEEERDYSGDDDSTDEEDYPYWANLKEDTTSPDEEELKEIEESGNEYSGLDHEHWENEIYEALDDPEYIPDDSCRITWTVKGVNGSPEKPNKEKVMRSPSVFVGGHYWNIKYYPRGDDGTEQLSIYIECSLYSEEERKTRDLKPAPSTTLSIPNTSINPPIAHEDSSSNTNTETAEPVIGTEHVSQQGELPGEAIPIQSSPTLSKVDDSPEDQPWEIAAQVGCVIYNPQEPRVHVMKKTSHRYHNGNPDWGWTRFHGPWDEIHKRRRCERQALLRNDTLAFTAYIRIVRDDTKVLWWHPGKESTEWDSVARTGLRGLSSGLSDAGAMASALSAWLHLAPIADLINNMPIPNTTHGSRSRIRPLFQELQSICSRVRETPTSSSPISLSRILDVMEWHGIRITTKTDVVAIWERLRHLLNEEGRDENGCEGVSDLFHEILMLRQPNLFKQDISTIDDFQAVVLEEHARPYSSAEPRSVQQTLDMALDGSEGFKVWEGLHEEKAYSTLPSVIQLELHRQSYASGTRRWKKLTHQIKIEEVISCKLSHRPPQEYTLYGMIVHTGDLESGNYFSVIRPRGPGTRWLKYASGRDEQAVTCLTTKQACETHEGSGTHGDGSAAVAYVVIYVRTEMLSEILRNSDSQDTVARPEKSQEPLGDSLEALPDREPNDEMFTAHVYRSLLFEDYLGRGRFDLWSPQWSSADSSLVLDLQFPIFTKLCQVQEYLATQVLVGEKPEHCWLWRLDTTPSKGTRWLPRFSLLPNREEKLYDLINSDTGGCHLWLHVLPADQRELVKEVPQSEPPPNLPNDAQISTDQEDPAANTLPTPDSNTTALLTAAMTERPALSGQDHLDETADGEDTVMEGTQDSGEAGIIEPLVTAEPSHIWASCEEPWDQIYFFLKIFDAESQTLRGLGSYLAKRKDLIKDVVHRKLSWPLSRLMQADMYREDDLLLDEKNLLRPNSNFEEGKIIHGSIIIVQERLSDEQITSLEASGKCANIFGYLESLAQMASPAFRQPYYTHSYFGDLYFSCSLHRGHLHGQGTMISLCGDWYIGSFTANRLSGTGMMAYANGNTYTGTWLSDEPHGQGKMVYAKTNNVYEGGFRKGKRHGKGTMQFEVADEEMALCRICYEKEMDCLLYDCGHVVACEECARLVETCPVCRKSVRAVVRIWRT